MEKGDCIVCCETIKNNVFCNECGNAYCGECYINIFRSGRGIVTCPYCRFKMGHKMNKKIVDICITDIRNKLNRASMLREFLDDMQT